MLLKPKIQHKAQILRDPLSETIYQTILNSEPPTGYNKKNWAIFKVTSTTLFYTGLRVDVCV